MQILNPTGLAQDVKIILDDGTDITKEFALVNIYTEVGRDTGVTTVELTSLVKNQTTNLGHPNENSTTSDKPHGNDWMRDDPVAEGS